LALIPDEAVASVYAELRRLAAVYMRRERSGHTLQPTALVNEAFLRLVQQRTCNGTTRIISWASPRPSCDAYPGRSQSPPPCAQARRRPRRHSIRAGCAAGDQRAADVIALDEALEALAKRDPQQARIVELRFFSGLSIEETAEVVGVSPSTIKREWNIAKAWLAARNARHGP
jgi:RNA polymerase sigma-70 factor (ECF subfamily)